MKTLPLLLVLVLVAAHARSLRKSAKRAVAGTLTWRDIFMTDLGTPATLRVTLGIVVLIPGVAALVAAAVPWVRPGIDPWRHLDQALSATAVLGGLGAAFTYVAICSLRDRPFFGRRASRA